MLKKFAVILFSICLLFPLSVAAWDDVGHKTTAYIAWRQMTPQARERVSKLLQNAPEDSDLSVFFMGDARSLGVRQMEHFMIASTWADIVRDRDFKARYGKYHKGNWHYSDTFWRGAGGQPVTIVENPNEEGGKAVEKLIEFDKVLRDRSASEAEKAIALAWILHLIGDLHQPLHTSARITDLEPKGDQGGNLFQLKPKETPRNQQENLHWFWDSIIVRNTPRGDECDTAFIPKVAGAIMKKYPAAKSTSRLNPGKYDDWQKESFQLATTEVFPATLIRYQSPNADYKKRAFQVSQQQIALAGYRMGALLNEIFGTPPAGNSQSDTEKYRREAEQAGSKIGQGENDSWIWFRTRAALLSTSELRDLTISLDVIESMVILKGTVAASAQKRKAEAVAESITGVKAVKNMLKVAPNDSLQKTETKKN